MNLAWGPCARRSKKCEFVESPTTSDDDLNEIFDYTDFLGRISGEYRILQSFLDSCSSGWPKGMTVSVLDLRCGRGEASRHMTRWARRNKWDLRILAVDSYARVVQMARERQAGFSEIVFDVRDLNDSRFLQARQFDYVISSMALHHEPEERVKLFLKTANRLARRGLFVMDWLRDIRPRMATKWVSSFYKSEALSHDAPLAVERGFTEKEVGKLSKEVGLEFAPLRVHFAYRFSLAGERELALAPQLAPIRPLAGA